MANEELKAYVEGALHSGKTREELRETLKSEGGWSDASIEEVLYPEKFKKSLFVKYYPFIPLIILVVLASLWISGIFDLPYFILLTSLPTALFIFLPLFIATFFIKRRKPAIILNIILSLSLIYTLSSALLPIQTYLYSNNHNESSVPPGGEVQKKFLEFREEGVSINVSYRGNPKITEEEDKNSKGYLFVDNSWNPNLGDVIFYSKESDTELFAKFFNAFLGLEQVSERNINGINFKTYNSSLGTVFIGLKGENTIMIISSLETGRTEPFFILLDSIELLDGTPKEGADLEKKEVDTLNE